MCSGCLPEKRVGNKDERKTKRVSHHGFHSVEVKDVVLKTNFQLPCSSLRLKQTYSVSIIYDGSHLDITFRKS